MWLDPEEKQKFAISEIYQIKNNYLNISVEAFKGIFLSENYMNHKILGKFKKIRTAHVLQIRII
jgi:mRNA-degrading endonuclease YafQ of YafQ-DinJ toxin-antitoxin module